MKIRRKQRQKRTHAVPWGILIAVAAVCFVAYCGVQGVMHIVDEWTEGLPSVEDSQVVSYSEKTRVYANDKTTLLAEFYLQDQEPVTIDQVNEYVLKGTVATEDERFYEHEGVDLMGIARALVNNLLGGDLEGASTITQQLVRGTLLSDEATEISFKRKIREAQLALEMEKVYSKDDILMMYLNTINYGDGCYGIEAAAQHYFQKSALDLTIAEAATLVGIPQSPTYNNPVTYPENSQKRRNTVLDRMFSNNVITKEEHDAAQAEPLTLNLAPTRSEDGIYLYPYFTSYVRQQLLESLSYDQVFAGGLTVYTTIDPTLQGYAEQAAQEAYESMADSGDTDVKLSLTCVDPHTGYVLAMIGGRDYGKGEGQTEFNLATDARRQAGSSFKMFTLAAAIEQGISPQTKIDCSRNYEYNGWKVSNSTGADYGIRSLESATWVSSNTGYARLVTDPDGVSPASVKEMAARLGVSGTEEEGFTSGPAITLGVAGTNTLSMASAYGTLSTGGVRYEDSCITQILDKDGNVAYDNTNPQGEQVLSPEVSYAVTRVLEGVLTQGTAAGYTLSSGQIAAGKTGTSDLSRDLWFCGYTPQLSCAVWSGADPERELWSAPWSRQAWKTFMDLALQGYDYQDFPTAADPKYDSAFTKKQKSLDEDEAKKKIEELAGKSLDEVKAALGDVTVVEQFNDTVAAGQVISIEFKDGVYIVYVSKGPDPATASISASVVGMSKDAALQALSAAGFGAANVEYQYSDTVAAGTVISQSATSGKRGDTVTIVVSNGPDPNAQPDPPPDPPDPPDTDNPPTT